MHRDTAAAWQGLPWVVFYPLLWLSATIATTLMSLAIPAVFIGARLADTDLLSHPERHRGLLLGVGTGGLALGALGAFHSALAETGMATTALPDPASTELTGLLGACGWLALLALYAGGPRPDGGLSGLRWVASAVGRRSMTAYLTQTILFGLIFAAGLSCAVFVLKWFRIYTILSSQLNMAVLANYISAAFILGSSIYLFSKKQGSFAAAALIAGALQFFAAAGIGFFCIV